MKVSIRKQLEEKMLDSTFAASLEYKWTSPDSVQDIFDGAMYKSVDPLNDPEQLNLSLTWSAEDAQVLEGLRIQEFSTVLCGILPHQLLEHLLLLVQGTFCLMKDGIILHMT